MTDFWTMVLQHLQWRPPALRFDGALESRFVEARASTRLQHFIGTGFLALFAFNFYLLSDRIMVPDVFEQALRLRLFVFTPVALGILAIAVRFKAWALRLPWWFIEGLVMMSGVTAGLSMGAILMMTHSPYGVMYRVGLMSILIYGNLVQRFRFRYAVVFSVSILLICLASMVVTLPEHNPYGILDVPVMLLLVLVSGYTLMMNFRMELEERRRFLRSERATALRAEIDASRSALDQLSRQDPLTGVPNRRHFDEAMDTAWKALPDTGASLGLLLIDVDHFKAYNDRYGHPTGDQCLRHVAQLLQQQVPASVGTVARWGGEEFIVLLPQADAVAAMRLGQSLAEAVAGLGLRHEASTTAPHVTISVGVAVTGPIKAHASPDGLVSQADAALYQAKHEGRNRCLLAAPSSVA